MWIRIGFNSDPDPAFYLNMDPDPAFYLNADTDPAFYLNADPDPGRQTNADSSRSWSTLVRPKWKAGNQVSLLKVHKIENFFGSDFEFCTISLLVLLPL